MEIYVLKKGQQTGPFFEYQLKELLGKGEVDEGDLAWFRGCDEWRPLREIDSLSWIMSGEQPAGEAVSDATGASPPPLPDEIPDTEIDRILNRTFAPKPWTRFWARFFDAYLYGALIFWVGLISGAIPPYDLELGFGLHPLVVMAIPVSWALFEAFFLSSWGATPGKILFGIRVLSLQGSRLGLGAAVKRSLLVSFFGWGLGIAPLWLISLIISFIRMKQIGGTLWDDHASTLVVQQELLPWRKAVAVFAVVAVCIFSVSLFVNERTVAQFKEAVHEAQEKAGQLEKKAESRAPQL